MPSANTDAQKPGGNVRSLSSAGQPLATGCDRDAGAVRAVPLDRHSMLSNAIGTQPAESGEKTGGLRRG